MAPGRDVGEAMNKVGRILFLLLLERGLLHIRGYGSDLVVGLVAVDVVGLLGGLLGLQALNLLLRLVDVLDAGLVP